MGEHCNDAGGCGPGRHRGGQHHRAAAAGGGQWAGQLRGAALPSRGGPLEVRVSALRLLLHGVRLLQVAGGKKIVNVLLSQNIID